MATKLIIDGNSVYEIDEDCMEYKRRGRRTAAAKGQEAERSKTDRKAKGG